jgi:hypothetical protein
VITFYFFIPLKEKIIRYITVIFTFLMFQTFAVNAVSAQAFADDSADSFWAGFSCVIWCLSCIGFTIMMVIDVAKRDEKVLPNKTLWLILMLFGIVIGQWGWIVALYYYFARKKKLDSAAQG